MLYLEAEDPDRDIHLYINSPGGSTTAGLTVYDTVQFVKNDVNSICIGQAISMGALLLSCATKGKRFALPHSRILLHQPAMTELSGQVTDIDIHAKKILRLRELTNQILAGHTGQDLNRIATDVERDYIMDAEQAKEHGIIDKIIEKHTLEDGQPRSQLSLSVRRKG